MKSTLFTKVLETETAEIDASVNDAINRLCGLQYLCDKIPPYRFYCNKDGKFKVHYLNFHWSRNQILPSFSVPTYYIKGAVTQNGTKSIAEINHVRGLIPILYMVLKVLGCLLLLLVSLLAPFITGNPILLVLFPLSIVFLFLVISDYTKRNNSENSDYEKLKQEVLNRIEMVNKWDK